MTSTEHYPTSPNDEPLTFSVLDEDFDSFQSNMLYKFAGKFIPDTVPLFVHEDIRVAGLSTQPVTGGSMAYSPDKPKAVAQTRSTYGTKRQLENNDSQVA